MKRNETIKLILVTMIILSLTLTACSPSQPTQAQTPDQPINPNLETVTDSAGRTVYIPEEIDSISALYTVAGHIIIMLDEGDIISSCSNGLKRDKLILSMEPSIKDIYLPKVGGIVNIEELLNSDPDIILLDAPLFWNKGELEKIENLNIPYYVVEFNSMDEEKKLVQDIGKIIGREEAAQEYVDFYDEVLALVDQTVADIPEDKKRQVYHAINEAVRTSATNTITAEWVERTGLINVAADKSLTKDEDKYYTTLEDILMWNPEVIMANDPGAYGYIKEQVAWKNIEAVLNDDIYLLPTGISRWGHSTSLETPLAMLWALQTLYPEYSKEIDLKNYTKRFYEELFEYKLTDEELQAILAGVDMRRAKDLED